MDRRSRNAFALILIVVIGVAAASVFVLNGAATGSMGPAGSETAVGVIVRVESEGLDQVTGFDLRTIDQGTLEFRIGVLENGAQFPPGHLVEHQASAVPVKVWYRRQDGARVAVRLEDAP
jgi:hypothetical protein